MNRLALWSPIVFAGTVIIIAAQFGRCPDGPACLEQYVQFASAGHFLLYLFLGLFVARYFSVRLKVGPIGTLVLTAAISIAFGVSDEVHQMFVIDRNAEFRDLGPDLLGGLAGALIYLWSALMGRAVREWNCTAELRAGLIAGLIAMTVSAGVIAAALGGLYALASDPSMNFLKKETIGKYFSGANNVRTASATVPPMQTAVAPQQTLYKAPDSQERTPPGLDDHVIQAVVRNLVHEMKKEISEEVRKELVNEITHLGGPAAVPAGAPSPVAAVIDRVVSPNGEWSSPARAANRNHTLVPSVAREKILAALHKSINPQEPGNITSPAEKQAEKCDLVAVLAHPSNPVRELTLDQVRKLFSGEYVNWREVGGPNLPVKVITITKSNLQVYENVKNHLKANLSPDAVSVPLLSFIIPSVAHTKGAIGFLPVANLEQLDFVAGHSAFKRIAIKSDDRSPGRLPNRMALNMQTYPIMERSQSPKVLDVREESL